MTVHPSPGVGPIPPSLRNQAQGRWSDCQEQANLREVALPPLDPEATEQLLRVWACSDFIAQSCMRHPAMLADLLGSGDLEQDYASGVLLAKTRAALLDTADDAGLMSALRSLRRREMVRIAWRDLEGVATLDQTMAELSELADAVLDIALARLYTWQCAQMGTPTGGDGQPQQMIVLAMGKLGARELNFSSDVDLVFALREDGATLGGRRELTSLEFFTRLGQRLIDVLSRHTADGFVYRVDMRLRPFGASGPLVMSLEAMDTYYQSHGRDWERYALIKARSVAGDVAGGSEFLTQIRPFVYRRYVDYGAVEALREMKDLIAQEVQRKGLQDDVKLGPGGIREIEFIAQAFQLIRGGRERALRGRSLLPVLSYLGESGYLPHYAVRELSDAYRFLRRTEHRIQEYADQQSQALPREDLERERLAFSMGYPGWHDFWEALDSHRRHAQTHFHHTFASPPDERRTSGAGDLRLAWQHPGDTDRVHAALLGAGFTDPAGALECLARLKGTYAIRVMSPRARQRLDQVVPPLLQAAGQSEAPEQTLVRLLALVEAVARRSVYLVLLNEHPEALKQLASLCTASPWIAAYITQHPLLLDELLDPRTLYAPPDAVGLAQELRTKLLGVPVADMEQEMDALRHFKQANVLRVAAADVSGLVPLMRVSDHLTAIGESVLQAAVTLAWRDLADRHGTPRYELDGEPVAAGFGIVAYGKLGGRELGYGSDLDLVFLHDSQGQHQVTDGEKTVENPVFFARLAQRLIHLLTTHTSAGTLYEVDFRLRPSGASGLLVSSLDAFAEYQQRQAWSWEHQALVRARLVVGEADLAQRFAQVRRQVLARPRDAAVLRSDVRDMRERMRAELGTRKAGLFDLKQDRGGIADIEFMVQYGVLLRAFEQPEMLRYTDNVRLLAALGQARLLSQDEASLLADIYRTYRARVHALALQEQKAVVAEGEFRGLREQVTAIWQRLMEQPG